MKEEASEEVITSLVESKKLVPCWENSRDINRDITEIERE